MKFSMKLYEKTFYGKYYYSWVKVIVKQKTVEKF